MVVISVLGLVFIAFVHVAAPDVPLLTAPKAAELAAAAAAKREADELAAKAEEARCGSDVQCIGDKKLIEASFKCAPLIERLAPE
jgi:hypothetical protein